MDPAYLVRQNAEQYRDFVSSLGNFEAEMKQKDLKAKTTKIQPETHVPVRGSATTSGRSSPKNTRLDAPAAIGGMSGVIKESSTSSSRIKGADYSAWDKFDADAAVEDVDYQVPKSKSVETLVAQPVVDAQSMENALLEKEKGNAFFKKGEFKKAVVCYNKSLQLDNNCVVIVNRAMAYLKLGMYTEAEQDCSNGLSLDSKNVKALWRRGMARFELAKYAEAKQDLERALILEPGNKSIKTDLDKSIRALNLTSGKTTPAATLSKASTPIVNKTALVDPKPKPIRRRVPIEEIGEPMQVAAAPYKVSKAKPKASTAAKSNTSSILLETTPTTSMVQEILAGREAELLEPSRPLFATPAATPESTTKKPKDIPKTTPTPVQVTAKPILKEASPERKSAPLPPLKPASASPKPLIQEISPAAVVSSVNQPIVAQSVVVNTTIPTVIPNSYPTPKLPPQGPRNLLEFEREWKAIKQDAQRASEFLRSINPSSLPIIFKSGLESLYLSRMLEVVAQTYTNEDVGFTALYDFVSNLAKVPRFHMLLMFFTKNDKQAVDVIFRHLREGEAQGAVSDIPSLEKLYK
ncbi:hypothetical protein SmJEL517_g05253 [Synchytrium microbalum]|uniref:RNA polymerase II-associated protein 3 n=1 Tax=Synchytrium microbalum TaxID=1806994 RepID=A0A507BV83_9FUNG|nr:uncharacterized protein SmJEL517_g05253 [Synchytrium microbalum]TPX31422.1 hypothetical protein SmJEL517_g05253 [Synchytrium microbalum]